MWRGFSTAKCSPRDPEGRTPPKAKGSPQSRDHLHQWRKLCVLIHPSGFCADSIKSLCSHRGGKLPHTVGPGFWQWKERSQCTFGWIHAKGSSRAPWEGLAVLLPTCQSGAGCDTSYPQSGLTITLCEIELPHSPALGGTPWPHRATAFFTPAEIISTQETLQSLPLPVNPSALVKKTTNPPH